SDKDGKLYILTLSDRKVTEIADTPRGQIRDYTWSPRGNYLAFSMAANSNNFLSIHIWSASDNQVRRVPDDMFNAYSPAWDPQGNYLYFLSDREFAPQISQVEFNYATNRTAYIYAMSLRKDVKHPFPPESDEVTLAKAEPAKDGEGTPKPEESPKPAAPPQAEAKPEPVAKPPAILVIDFNGISSRVAPPPPPASKQRRHFWSHMRTT